MLVEIPVTITFDHSSAARNGGRSMSRVFTLRYDTVDTDRDAEWVDHYPSRDNAQWLTDKQGVFFDLFSSSVDKSIKEAAERDPDTYRSKVAEHR